MFPEVRLHGEFHVEFDPEHVIYVWLDALSNYITALGYDVDKESDNFNRFWPADVHVIGKDIMRFHSIYWPIFLMALDLPLPKKIFGHPWLLFGADKMSKSKGNVLYADELAQIFGVDGVRHYVLSEMPYASDGSITYEALIGRYNSDLANNLGNLVKRTVDMSCKYFDGVVQEPSAPEALDCGLKKAVKDAIASVCENMTVFMLQTRRRRYSRFFAVPTNISTRQRHGFLQKTRIGVYVSERCFTIFLKLYVSGRCFLLRSCRRHRIEF